MCAIAGLYQASGRPVDAEVLARMVQVQAHRGPDGEGYVLIDPTGKGKPVELCGPLTPSPGASRVGSSLAMRTWRGPAGARGSS